MIQRTILIGLSLLVALSLESACSNTLDGVGQDVERAGQKIQKTF